MSDDYLGFGSEVPDVDAVKRGPKLAVVKLEAYKPPSPVKTWVLNATDGLGDWISSLKRPKPQFTEAVAPKPHKVPTPYAGIPDDVEHGGDYPLPKYK